MGLYAPSRFTTTPPVVTPRPFGLFSVARPTEDTSPHWRNGETWEPDPCGTVGGIGPICGTEDERLDESTGSIGLPKQFKVQDGLVDTTPFVVYGSSVCSPIGRDPEESIARARRDLELHEERGVEQFIWTGELGNAPSLVSPETEDLTVTSVSPAVAIGLLEQYIASRYGGIGVLHIPRLAVPVLGANDFIHVDGDQLRTKLGTPVAAYSADPNTSPAGAPAAEGTAWAYVTPNVKITRSQVFSDDLELKLLDRRTNDLYAVAERHYSVGWDDCGVAGANFTLD